MPKVTFSKTAIINLADYVLKNYGHINETVEAGITATQKTYTNIKLTSLAVYDMFQATAKYMQAVENEGVLKGLAKKEAVLEFMIKEYLETHAEIKQIWSGWHTTVSWFIDSLISMLNSGRSVLQACVGEGVICGYSNGFISMDHDFDCDDQYCHRNHQNSMGAH